MQASEPPRRRRAASRHAAGKADPDAQAKPKARAKTAPKRRRKAESEVGHGPGHGHGHGHGHGPVAPASRKVRILLAVLLIPCALATLIGALVLYPFGREQATGTRVGLNQVPVQGVITAAKAGECGAGQCLSLSVKLMDGPASERTITIPGTPIEPSTPRFAVGDEVVLAYAGKGSDPFSGASYQVVDFQRGLPLTVLAVLFALAVLVLARWRGLAALGALALSFLLLVFFALPSMLAGEDPLTVAVVTGGLIMFVAMYLTHGITARTSVAVLGILGSLGLIGLLGWLFSAMSKLTGLDEDTANLIGILGHEIDARGLLMAGIVIGALGVLDDVTVTQASAVWELRLANPALGWRKLYAAGLRIGRDHVGSAVNTLFMAYAGAALPMMLAYSLSGRSFGDLVTAQAVAQEVVRTLVGSIGLVAAVPVTTLLAALVAVREPVPEKEPDAAPAAVVVEPEPDPEPIAEEPPEPLPRRPARKAPPENANEVTTPIGIPLVEPPVRSRHERLNSARHRVPDQT
ncbi:hypothetical protein GCM10022247_72500 [Allokutzneria multivorans]|uniref:YibE/F family protein n=1 Tax=Allokutzneria multivorans TaxID=1142134 RepID=A0ABP7U579_9PSEU